MKGTGRHRAHGVRWERAPWWSSGQRLRRVGALVLAVLLIGSLPVLAATVDINIPLETIIRGAEGSQHVLAVVDVPAESQGETCQATVVARNQDSEHPDSDLVISSETSVAVLDVENTAYGTVLGGGPITLSDSVTVILTLGADRVFSAGLDVVIDCPPLNPTTTTTTAPDSSTSTTGDGGGGSTSTTGDGGGGSTSTTGDGGGGSTSTTGDGVGGSTSTTGDGGPPGTALGTSITAPSSTVAASAETLPFTGLTEGSMGGIATSLVILGALMLLSIRRRETEAIVARHWHSRIAFYEIEG